MSNLIKKVLLFFTIVFSCIFISNFALANEGGMDDARNDIRNVVGGAENVVEDAAIDVSNAAREGTGRVEGDATSGMNQNNRDTTNNANNANNNSGTVSDFSATRTATGDTGTTRAATAVTTSNDNTVWTWFIVGIIAIVIIGVIWYMASKNNNSSNR